MMSFYFVGCESTNGQSNTQVVVNQSQPNIGDNLDLRALGEIIKNSRNPQEIEQKLNADNSINNLDLDGDGNRDYLKVTEYGKGAEHGYSICAVLKDGSPEVANVTINTTNNQMNLNGNPNYYGSANNTYQSTFSAADFMLLAWMMQPRYNYYVSPYYYGHYGYGYTYGRRVVPYYAYHQRPFYRTISTNRSYRVTRTPVSSRISSPNARNSSSIATQRASNFSKPTSSQRSFGVGSSSNSTRTSTGFGNKSSSTTSRSYSTPSSSSRSYSTPSSSSSSSRSSFGSSSRSSFGSSSRSSGSSSRSGRR